MNRWINPPPPIKFENEFPPQDNIGQSSWVTYPPEPFATYKKQVGKKKVSKKSKKERIVEKTLHLSKRLQRRN